MTEARGDRIGKYVIRRKLAEGGMAEIFLCTLAGPEGFAKQVVVKRIRPSFVSDPLFVQRFIAEARLASLLNHANVVQIFDFGKESNDAFFLAMEYVPGCSLWELKRRCSQQGCTIPPVLAARIVSEVARGLHHAHRLTENGRPLNLVHRDVSPHNVLLSNDGAVKIADFGVAKAASSTMTATGMLVGKFAYMSPEQARGEQVDARTDVFALGIVLWELLTGGRLFEANSDIGVLRAVEERVIIPPARANPDIPPDLDAAVMRALDRNPETRFQSAQELERALAECVLRHARTLEDTDVAAFMQRLAPDEPTETDPIARPQVDEDENGDASTHERHVESSGTDGESSSPGAGVGREPTAVQAPAKRQGGTALPGPNRLVGAEVDAAVGAEGAKRQGGTDFPSPRELASEGEAARPKREPTAVLPNALVRRPLKIEADTPRGVGRDGQRSSEAHNAALNEGAAERLEISADDDPDAGTAVLARDAKAEVRGVTAAKPEHSASLAEGESRSVAPVWEKLPLATDSAPALLIAAEPSDGPPALKPSSVPVRLPRAALVGVAALASIVVVVAISFSSGPPDVSASPGTAAELDKPVSAETKPASVVAAPHETARGADALTDRALEAEAATLELTGAAAGSPPIVESARGVLGATSGSPPTVESAQGVLGATAGSPPPVGSARAVFDAGTPEPVKRGELELRVLPWAQVWIDGEELGEVHVKRVLSLAPGTHRLRFVHPRSTVEKSVVINPSKRTTTKFDARRAVNNGP